ncbi:MAG: ATP-dependent DNA helicase RecG [Bacteroidota bacterium]
MSSDLLLTPIVYLKGVGPKRATSLEKELEIRTFGDLLTYYPFRYVDRTKFTLIREISSDLVYVQLRGKISNVRKLGKTGSERLSAILNDGSGNIELVWFKGVRWIIDTIKPGQEYVVFGKPTIFNAQYNIPHPEIEVSGPESTQSSELFQPFYNSTEKLKTQGLDSKGIRKIMRNLIEMIPGKIPELISFAILDRFKLLSREEALIIIHFPPNPDELKKAQARLKFEELFFIQLQLLRVKAFRQTKITGFRFAQVGDYFNRFYKELLPFPLTNAQKRVIKEIRADMGSGKQMNRLLQGDVGSGKTLVALMIMLIALDNGYQACLMAPTELLAIQHYNTLTRMLQGMDIRLELLTGSTKAKHRRTLHESLRTGVIQILIGTHTLIEDTVKFQNPGLVIIDEQHRFGVMQRASLWEKSETPPHMLVMTATPIPRTLAMTLYGDLDVSVIDELPPGRKAVQTLHYFDSARLRVLGFVKRQIQEGRQIYWVFPLINESETLDMKFLAEGFDSLCIEYPAPKYAISMVHGQMKPDEKDFEMKRFVKGETDIMVATTVIEVGVDVPNASVMVVENAERFGLSQLHQLRGRVGRGADQSYCLLMTGYKLTAEARKRIETMVRTTDGFEIAEADLRLRGPGDLQGTQQSGIIGLKIADIIRDEKIIKIARDMASDVLRTDPDLSDPDNRVMRLYLQSLSKQSQDLGRIS